MNDLKKTGSQFNLIDRDFGSQFQRLQASGGIVTQRRSDALQPPPRSVLESHFGQGVVVEWLAGDGSDRCYYRIKVDQKGNTPAESYVLMQLSTTDAKQLARGEYDWLRVAELLQEHGICHPRPVKVFYEYAALLIEDYGDEMLENRLYELARQEKKGEIESFYDQAVDLISEFLNIKNDPNHVWRSRSFDAEKYTWELNFFLKHFVTNVCNYILSEDENRAFVAEVSDLSTYLSTFSTFCVHRDFHARNLMVKGNNLAVIDFQDMRLGHPYYDLVSLVYDNYTPFSIEFRNKLMSRGISQLDAECGIDQGLFRDSAAAVVLQRQLKAIGTYGYLTLEKKRGNYLCYVKPAQAAIQSYSQTLIQRWPLLTSKLGRLTE